MFSPAVDKAWHEQLGTPAYVALCQETAGQPAAGGSAVAAGGHRRAVSGWCAGHFAQQDDVLAPQEAVGPVQQGPQPLRGLGAHVEEVRLDGFGVAVGAVDSPGRQARA
ncbi:hypothetical protein [Streptomyces sp. NBC_01014]|uniref:hypothetical protein n=1 Tax=Streptomyces sp. NBC_01014 TaxID=2903719 RepID=UPI00386367E6|nr:hypothetical protein OG282_34210 [Streptomyces sp. NBC_01014]